MNRSKTLLVALALVLPTGALAACGGSEDSDEDPEEVLEATFDNDTQIESGVLDLTFDLSVEGAQGGSLQAAVSGPITSDPDDPSGIGQLDLDVTLSGDGTLAEQIPEDFEAGIVVTEDNLFVNYQGTDYELGEKAFADLQEQQEAATGASEGEEASTFREGCEQAIEAQGGDPAACDFEVTAWFTDLENEGTEDVGGAETTHISGSLDVSQMLEDLVSLGTSTGAGGVDPSLIQGQVDQAAEAIEGATFDVYSATEDDTLRGLDFGLDIDAASAGGSAVGVDSASIGFSFELSDVGEEQTFEAPSDAKPIEDLASEFGLPGGIPGTGIPGGPELPGGGAAGTPDPDCIAEAAGDPDAITKCLE